MWLSQCFLSLTSLTLSSVVLWLTHFSGKPSPPSFPTRRSSDLDRVRVSVQHRARRRRRRDQSVLDVGAGAGALDGDGSIQRDRKSTRLNSSHGYISYAVFCLKKTTRRPPKQTRPQICLCL